MIRFAVIRFETDFSLNRNTIFFLASGLELSIWKVEFRKEK
jgi:hypothetical protein